MILKTLKKISHLGIRKGMKREEVIQRKIFNQLTFFGASTTWLQAFYLGAHDAINFTLIVSLSLLYFISLYFQYRGNFTLAKILTFYVSIFIGSTVAMRLGAEYMYHFSSIALLFPLILISRKDQWMYLICFIVLDLLLGYLVTTDYFKVDNPLYPKVEDFRVIHTIGLIFFLGFEVFAVTRVNSNHNKVIEEEIEGYNRTVQIQNNEINLLLKELHHRVKNNLQIIISLLRLKSNEVDDDKSKKYFQEAISKIHSISLIHKKLYQRKDINCLKLDDYISDLTDSLLLFYNTEKEITLKLNSALENVHPDQVVSFGLLLNELISNSIKHAFLERNKGEIHIDISENEKNEVVMVYGDTGEWVINEKVDSFGLDLIESLTAQLGGKYNSKQSKEGTFYNFKFSELKV